MGESSSRLISGVDSPDAAISWNPAHGGSSAMDVLATFPTVRVPGAPGLGKESVSCATVVPRRSRSIWFLAVIAACTWTAAWLLERQPGAAGQSATVATAAADDGESVTR
jgi:hypothetical protein